MKSPIIKISEKYQHLSNEIKSVPEIFENNGRAIKLSRNKIKEFNWQGTPVCIKSYKRPTIFNQFIYTYFRMGKAKRSFTYANQLLDFGINTPEPIAYIEQFNRIGWLSKSYYICIYESYLLRFNDLLDSDMASDEKRQIIEQFVEFVDSSLYRNYILNKDFNGGNVLINRGKGRYVFSLVDINRIHFDKEIDIHTAIANINMVSDDPQMLLDISKAYANLKHIEPKTTAFRFFASKYINGIRRHYRKKTLKPLKNIGKAFNKN